MPAQRAWTVLVWMAGDNDLEDFGSKDLRELKKVGSTDDVAIAVQLDRMADEKTRRYFVRKGGVPAADVVADLDETNTGDPAVASDFFTWGMQTYPSKHVLAVMWNHGSGIDETDIYKGKTRALDKLARGERGGAGVPRRRIRDVTAKRFRRALFSTTIAEAIADRGIAYDDTAADFLDNVELKKVLDDVKAATGRGVDLLGFDACLMNMVEVAYQCRSVADYIVGSQELEPGDGWPYDKVLADLVAKPSMTPAELGETVVRRYLESYDDDTITQSLLDMSRSKPLADAVDQLAAELLGAIEDGDEYKRFRQAANNAQAFDTPGFLDLVDLCRQITERTTVSGVKQAAADVIAAAVEGPKALVRKEGHEGSTMAGAHGVSIYVPKGGVTVAYDKLAFADDTRWGKLLEAYTA